MWFGKFEIKIQDCLCDLSYSKYIYLSQHTGFATGGGGDAPQVRRGANARIESAQFRDKETRRTDVTTCSRYRRGGSSMDHSYTRSSREKQSGRQNELLYTNLEYIWA